MSDTEPPTQVDEQEPAPAPLQETSPGITPGSEDLAPSQLEQPVAASPLLCAICSHPESVHTSDGRCLVMRGDFGLGGPCTCPEIPTS